MRRHLVGAIRAYLSAQPSLSALLKGGVADSAVDRDKALPYLVLSARDLQSTRVFTGGEVQIIRIEFAAMTKTRDSAETIGNLIRDLIIPRTGDAPWVPLLIAGGWQDVNRQPAGGDVIELDMDEKAARGNDVWSCKRPINWTVAR